MGDAGQRTTTKERVSEIGSQKMVAEGFYSLECEDCDTLIGYVSVLQEEYVLTTIQNAKCPECSLKYLKSRETMERNLYG